jgi:hypothetical protein
VTDIDSGEPIENVNISVRNSNTGTITDELGWFQVWITRLPFSLEFSHISFEAKNIGFEHKPLQKLKVLMSRKSEPLSEVVITSHKTDTLYANRLYSVLDYELCEHGILLLIYKTRLSRSELLLLDYNGTILLDLKVLPMKPLGLFRDCLGEIHILSQDQAWQVSIQDTKMILYDPYAIDYFTEVMTGCRFKVGKKVYFEDFEYYDLIKKFYYVTTIDTSWHLLAVAADQDKIDFLRQNPENLNISQTEAELSLLARFNGTSNDKMTLDLIRNLDESRRFNKMAYLRRIYAPLFVLADSILIFDHPNNRIQFYDYSDSLIGETTINYHLSKGSDTLSEQSHAFLNPAKWKEEIWVDGKRNRAYTAFQHIDGTKDLKEIDLRTGVVTFKVNIPFPYVQKIKVRDGYLYYVYKGFGEYQNKKLFRQRID